jgi:hypothetical protein
MHQDGDAHVWDLEIVDEPWREERRVWARVAAAGSIRVAEVVDGVRSLGPRTASGELVDISEVATRCRIEVRAIWACRRGARVRASFFLGDVEIEVSGQVIASKISAGEGEPHEIVVRFDQPVAVAETLRHHVRSQQQAMRRGSTE